MFQVIYNHEIQFWLKKLLIYFFALFLMGLSLVSVWGMASEATDFDIVIQNSSYKLYYIINFINQLMLFIIPTIIGMSIYRDYSSRMYRFLYAYPFNKRDYLLAKFSSAFTIVFIISLATGLGAFIGTIMPGVNKNALKAFEIIDYLHIYFIYTLPNVLLMSIIVFAIVTFSRNIFIGFIAIILLTILNRILSSVLNAYELYNLAIILDPFGEAGIKNSIRFWTLEERNNLPLPFSSLILVNRFVWITITVILGIITYRKFEFNQFISSFSKNTKSNISASDRLKKIKKLEIPKVKYNFSFKTQIKSIWKLSHFDFTYIVKSWPFISLVLVGGIMVYLQQSQMAPKYGFEIYPTTAQMLQVPLFIFSTTINLVTFLYMGIIIYRAKHARIDAIIDTTAQSNWVFASSKLLAIFRVQLVLLFLVLITGIIAQFAQGYYRFEIGHYLYELFFLHFLHFAIWAAMALFIFTIVKNLYLSFFITGLIPVLILMLPEIANTLKLDWLKESVLQFNMVPDMFLGFEYSDFNQYGTQLVIYFLYKFYWIWLSIFLIILSIIFWKREITFGLKERFRSAINNSSKWIYVGLSLSIISFISLGAKIYHEEHHVSITNVSEQEQDGFAVHNEINYKKYKNLAQPRISKVYVDMNINPVARDFIAQGRLYFVNKSNKPIDTIIVAKNYIDSTRITILNNHKMIIKDSIMRYELISLNSSLEIGDTLYMNFSVRNYPNSLLHNNSRVLRNGTFINSRIIPKLGIRNVFLKNANKRKKYGLEELYINPATGLDSSQLDFRFSENNMEYVDYESRITTTADHMAFTVGDLISTEKKNNIVTYHYKSNQAIRNSYAWISGNYVHKKDSINGILLNAYHHKNHAHNYQSIFSGLKASIRYCEKHFTDLQHEEINIIEFPLSYGSYATIVGNMMPYSESQFLCSHKHHDKNSFNFLYYSSAHEVSHYWWGQQIDPANIPGAKLITESVAEYIANRVFEKEIGIDNLLKTRKKLLNIYLETRASKMDEIPLVEVLENQEYIAYQKGSIVLNHLSTYIGEDRFNEILKSYLIKHSNNKTPFAHANSFVRHFETNTPDSLKYLISDLFHTITLYDNVINNSITEKSKGKYTTQIDFTISKFRSDRTGKKFYSDEYLDEIKEKDTRSLSLNDYIMVQLKGEENENKDFLIKVKSIKNTRKFDTSFKPKEIIIDPYYLLIEKNKKDNHKINI